MCRYFCRGEEATRSITNCHFVLLFQSENGLREIGPRKDRNAAPLCHGNVFSAFCFFLRAPHSRVHSKFEFQVRNLNNIDHRLPKVTRKPLENYSNAGQKSAVGRFLSKLVYDFRPAKILYACQNIHIGGGQQQKLCTKSSKP